MIRPDTLNILFLAAGRGTRLRPITLETPKPLITVFGETLLGRLLRQFNNTFGRQSFWINISTMPEKFIEFFKFSALEESPTFIWEPTIQGSASTINYLSHQSPKPLLVVHSDLVLSDEYVTSIHRLLKQSQFRRNFIFCHTRPWNIARSVVLFDKNFCVTSFKQGSLQENNGYQDVYVNSGLYFFNSPIPSINRIPLDLDVTEHQIPVLVQNKLLFAKLVSEKRISIDSLEALETVHNYFKV
jgi:NDP-sugar pyrophosphorylase family protein